MIGVGYAYSVACLCDCHFGVAWQLTEPEGRLPFSWPTKETDVPPPENYTMATRTYRYGQPNVAFPFGFGAFLPSFFRWLAVRACVRASKRACVRASERACERACVRACVRTCVRACVRVCARVCVCVCVCA